MTAILWLLTAAVLAVIALLWAWAALCAWRERDNDPWVSRWERRQ